MFEQCVYNLSLDKALIPSLFLAGLAGGATHCVGMCSPFVLAQVDGSSTTQKQLKRVQDFMLLPYHMGRITTYAGMAVFLSMILNLAFLFQPARALLTAPLLMLAGVIFLVSAFPSLGTIFPWAARLHLAWPYRWISGAYRFLSVGNSRIRHYFLGVLLGFMPCGLVLSAIMAASTAQSYIGTATAMIAFGLGTVPALTGVALAGRAVKSRYPLAAQHITKGLMACSALWLFIIAGQAFF